MSGPTTKDTSSLALGLAQVRVVASASNIAKTGLCSTTSDSIGALTSTKFTAGVEYFKHKSGFPMKEDLVLPLSETAMLECAYEEITPFNIALARGIDPTSGYTNAHSGEITLGALVAPSYVRMEAVYTFPNGTNTMFIIFPRAQVTSNQEVDLQAQDNAKPTVTFESKLSDATVSGGNACWNDKPLGYIQFT